MALNSPAIHTHCIILHENPFCFIKRGLVPSQILLFILKQGTARYNQVCELSK